MVYHKCKEDTYLNMQRNCLACDKIDTKIH